MGGNGNDPGRIQGLPGGYPVNRIGIDLGGTKIEGILIDGSGQIKERIRKPTNSEDGYQSIVERIVKLIKKLRDASPGSVHIGVCTPGAISPVTGRIKNSNTLCLIGQPLREDIEERIGQSIQMDNDANCFTAAEAIMGAGRNHQVVFGVIMGTGVGGGIVINKRIFQGRMRIAGEWGHHTLYPDGNKCYCGQIGCVETYISGPALEKRWLSLTGKKLSLTDIVEKVGQGHKIIRGAEKWRQEFINNFGLALSNVIDILDPDIVVLGGGVSNVPFLYDEGMRAVHSSVFSDHVDTPIVKNECGDSAGVIGAAYL
jgi:fructokinase